MFDGYYCVPVGVPPVPPETAESGTPEYDPRRPVPPGYEVEWRSFKPFWIPGISVFGAAYGLTIAVETFDHPELYRPFDGGLLYLPILGPWLALASKSKCSNDREYRDAYDDCEDHDDFVVGSLVVSGVFQSLGAALFTVGVTWKRPHLVKSERVQATLVPATVGAGNPGLALVGSF
jgi:hypothetical protein